jgi:hypothetical protein
MDQASDRGPSRDASGRFGHIEAALQGMVPDEEPP